jgi:FtsP/CotA-like multicopper oxidase with cupredoxin domain
LRAFSRAAPAPNSARPENPTWTSPPAFKWDYTRFGRRGWTPPTVDDTIEMSFTKDNAALDGFNPWRINGTAFSMDDTKPLFTLRHGARYRLRPRNATDDIHPIHLHRHSFEIVSVAVWAINADKTQGHSVVLFGSKEQADAAAQMARSGPMPGA